jgi:hypothetical protein
VWPPPAIPNLCHLLPLQRESPIDSFGRRPDSQAHPASTLLLLPRICLFPALLPQLVPRQAPKDSVTTPTLPRPHPQEVSPPSAGVLTIPNLIAATSYSSEETRQAERSEETRQAERSATSVRVGAAVPVHLASSPPTHRCDHRWERPTGGDRVDASAQGLLLPSPWGDAGRDRGDGDLGRDQLRMRAMR